MVTPNAGSIDPMLKDVGTVEGLCVWRIKKFKLEKIAHTHHGIFYDGDAYIVLSTKDGADSWDVHFWIGKNASIDEMGTAAIKAVEIDQALGGFPVQYREVQGHESALFMSYFKNNLRYPTGGHESGFNTVEDLLKDFQPKLYRCKGKRNVRCTEVRLSLLSLNLGDVFILDTGADVFVWMPPQSGRLERIRGMERAKNIAEHERQGKSKVVLLDDEWNKSYEFWKHFGGKDVIPRILKASDDDEDYWERNKDRKTLWKVNDASGEAQVTKIAQGDEVKQNLLDSNDAFILDAVNGGVYVWVGKGCTVEERSRAFHWGQTYLYVSNLPSWTTVTRVLESNEPQMFSQWFDDWAGAKKKAEFTPRLFQCSNETGKLVIEEIAGYDQEDLDGDDVMVLDALNIIYVWVGAGANAEERKEAEKTAQGYLNNSAVKRHKKTVIETVFQGQETSTFKKFFSAWDEKMFKNQARSVANMRKILFK
ncbi:hypothetical protein PFISCL1PPCAC_16074 [Pristionchus fissidentatus]|uniref:Gelsolin-like domain-containing protein n=1 Tax=Pristionchus fissidentatus TaxID=1538716 RepID=A0AAV5W3T7_9BILA|nr:hypothetical protein PFISCL1PPCAC_16074 [Pristionchus fissidentatus]